MAEISLSLAELFEQTFGYKTRAFEPEFKHVTGDGNSLSDRKEQGASGSPYYATDAQGREYFMPVTLTYEESSALPDTPTTASTLKKWDLPYPVISITSKKTVVETALTERRGTVKELINVQDYEIIVKGFIVGNTHEFPENDMATLRTIYEQNTAISIACPLTDIFLLRPGRSGSDQVVITELKFPAVTGIKNVRPYELKLVSDEPFNLLVIDK
jgi:hypothetical protein